MIILRTQTSTLEFGNAIGRTISAPLFIYLVGSLGSGKTVFTKGLLTGLGVQDSVTSPSFSIAKEYIETRIRSVHIDLFRIESFQKFESLGLMEYFDGSWIVICEWSNRISTLPHLNLLELLFTTSGESERTAAVTRYSVVGQRHLLSLLSDMGYDTNTGS